MPQWDRATASLFPDVLHHELQARVLCKAGSAYTRQLLPPHIDRKLKNRSSARQSRPSPTATEGTTGKRSPPRQGRTIRRLLTQQQSRSRTKRRSPFSFSQSEISRYKLTDFAALLRSHGGEQGHISARSLNRAL